MFTLDNLITSTYNLNFVLFNKFCSSLIQNNSKALLLTLITDCLLVLVPQIMKRLQPKQLLSTLIVELQQCNSHSASRSKFIALEYLISNSSLSLVSLINFAKSSKTKFVILYILAWSVLCHIEINCCDETYNTACLRVIAKQQLSKNIH